MNNTHKWNADGLLENYWYFCYLCKFALPMVYFTNVFFNTYLTTYKPFVSAERALRLDVSIFFAEFFQFLHSLKTSSLYVIFFCGMREWISARAQNAGGSCIKVHLKKGDTHELTSHVRQLSPCYVRTQHRMLAGQTSKVKNLIHTLGRHVKRWKLFSLLCYFGQLIMIKKDLKK